MVVVVRLRRSWLWWAGSRSVYALLRRSNAVARLLYSGGATWTGCSGRRRCGGRCDGDDVPRTGIAICLSAHILMARSALKRLLRVLRRRKGILVLPVRWCSMSGRCLVVRRWMVVLFTGDGTSLVLEARICAAALATVIRRVGIPARLFLFFLFVSRVKAIFRCLLFGREWIGHAPFRPLFLLSRRHVVGAGHGLRGIGCGLTTQATGHLLKFLSFATLSLLKFGRLSETVIHCQQYTQFRLTGGTDPITMSTWRAGLGNGGRSS